MSAIVGMIDWRGGPVGAAVRQAMDALTLHGRDGEGFWDGGDVALGWRQTILHAEDRADQQPLTGGAGRFKLVFDGRIDNREELAAALSLHPERARDWPDSAYAMAAFEKWGEDTPARLLGDFSFAVWDGQTRELFLARDHLGSRPLFYHSGRGFLMFATMPSGLFSNPDVPRDIDDDSFLLDLAAVPRDPDATLYRGIARVPIGHAVLASERSISTLRHWRPETIPLLNYKRDDDYVEAFREVLDESVRCRLRTIHPIGTHLSSGFDSSTVTAVAAGLLAREGRGLTAFTAVPPLGWRPDDTFDGEADEGPAASALARRYANLEHVLVRSTGRFDFSALDRHGDAFEAPRRSVFTIGWLEHLSHDARSRGVRVMLSGAMGNRTISHDGLGLLPYLLRHGRLAELASEWFNLKRRGVMRYRGAAALTFGPSAPDWLWALASRAAGRVRPTALMRSGLHPDRFTESELGALARHRALNPTNAHRADDRSMRFVASQTPDLAYLWAATPAAFDIDTRDPTSDRRLVAFRVATPERQFLRRGQTKWLLQRAMKGVLPPEIRDLRHHAGQQAAEWFEAVTRSRDAFEDEIDRLAANSRMAALIDIAGLRDNLAAWPATVGSAGSRGALTARRYRRFVVVVAYARFMRRFVEQEPRTP